MTMFLCTKGGPLKGDVPGLEWKNSGGHFRDVQIQCRFNFISCWFSKALWNKLSQCRIKHLNVDLSVHAGWLVKWTVVANCLRLCITHWQAASVGSLSRTLSRFTHNYKLHFQKSIRQKSKFTELCVFLYYEGSYETYALIMFDNYLL